MLTETTVSKLREMRLSVMANALKDQLADPRFQNMTFEDRIGLLVDAEWHVRKNNHLNKLIRQATFSDPGACLENVEHLPDRGLKQEEPLLNPAGRGDFTDRRTHWRNKQAQIVPN